MAGSYDAIPRGNRTPVEDNDQKLNTTALLSTTLVAASNSPQRSSSRVQEMNSKNEKEKELRQNLRNLYHCSKQQAVIKNNDNMEGQVCLMTILLLFIFTRIDYL